MGFDNNFLPIKAPPISPERHKELILFQKLIGLRFRRLDLLNLAFTHRSYANEFQGDIDNNEKLEFLGDSILGLVINEYLFINLPGRTEGDLSKIKSFVVSESSLEVIAKKIKIDNFILIGKGEEYSGGRTKKAIIGDAMEALIGAYYLDSGFKKIKKFIYHHFIPEINKVLENRHRKDYKTLLQEYVQKKYKTYPKYSITQKKGPDHDKTFWMSVTIKSKIYGPGQGKNKKEAEQNAAMIAYTTIIKDKK
ncbi:MAG: ribonuclease III [Spirochaetales bacterium]|nr:ribonuclease III [Spirochaetales bacterium]